MAFGESSGHASGSAVFRLRGGRVRLSTVIQVLAAVLISVGVGLVSIPAGLIVFGVLGLVFGVALERGGG